MTISDNCQMLCRNCNRKKAKHMNINELAEKYVKANYPNIIGDDFQAIKEAYIDGFNTACLYICSSSS